jgi:thiol-disulfide isomerase/thioredoxin
MKYFVFISLLAMGLSFGSCQSKAKEQTAKTECSGECKGCAHAKEHQKQVAAEAGDAGVYYFHGDRKCKTCKAVGAKAKEIAEKMNVSFFDINFDKEENKELAKHFQASSSGLYILSKKSGMIENLTTFAFRNAINDEKAYAEKLETVIKAEL